MRLVTPFLMLLALAISPPAGRAQPAIRIAFDDCPGGPAATTQKSDECASNSGSAMDLVVSFVYPLDPTPLVAITAELEVHPVHPAPLSDWWRLQSGGCRSSAATVGLAVNDLASCGDPWANAEVAYTSVTFHEASAMGASYQRLLVDVGAAAPVPLQHGATYQAFTLSVLRAKTTGPNACAGCCAGACIVLRQVVLHLPGFDFFTLQALDPQFVSWQGDYQIGLHGGGCLGFGSNCPVATGRGTWGELKVLYR
jgi:hypothetical protein